MFEKILQISPTCVSWIADVFAETVKEDQMNG